MIPEAHQARISISKKNSGRNSFLSRQHSQRECMAYLLVMEILREMAASNLKSCILQSCHQHLGTVHWSLTHEEDSYLVVMPRRAHGE
ncbi:hypothetical protein CY35_04G042500 [Sphagnum magellanicum]|nr:hypothetical protein CY35_04G042500 [Sphagnum magellanicum]